MSMYEAPSRAMRRRVTKTRLGLATALLLVAGACTDNKSATDLNIEGPPMVQQVFVNEKKFTSANSAVVRFGLAFGDHPDIPQQEEDALDGDDRVVDNAIAATGASGAKLRIVLDELVRGNDIEEILCADDTYSRVPVGTDPDDIAKCSPPDLSECEAVCIGESGPVGIKDRNGDGAVDDFMGYGVRMIDYGGGELAASVVCDGQLIPLISSGPGRSFFNPSGNQFIPAGAGVNGLGPALVLIPALGLRSGSTCTVAFRPEVVDKDGNRVCAPPGGDIKQDCAGEGNTEAISFQVEPLAFSVTTPSNGDVLEPDGVFILLEFVTKLDASTLGAITMSTGGTDVPIDVSVAEDDASKVRVNAPGGYLPDSEYTITVGTGVSDMLGGTPAEPFTLVFSTGPGDAPPADAGPDGGPADAGPPDAA